MPSGMALTFTPSELQSIGPIIKVLIGHSLLDKAEAASAGLEFPEPRPISALIDTGAALTIINPRLAETYKLKYVGEARISAAGHTQDCRAFAPSIAFTNTQLRLFETVSVVACPLNRPEIACLIGRDILRYWELNYNGTTGEIRIRDLRS